MKPSMSLQSQSVHKIVREALQRAALEPTPNAAIDVLGDALARLDRMVSKRELHESLPG